MRNDFKIGNGIAHDSNPILKNQNKPAGFNNGFSTTYYGKNHRHLQRVCLCGATIRRDEIIFENRKICHNCELRESSLTQTIETMVTTPAKAVKAVKCEGCKKLTSAGRLVIGLPICRQCLIEIQTKAQAVQNLFIAKVIGQAQRALRTKIRGAR